MKQDFNRELLKYIAYIHTHELKHKSKSQKRIKKSYILKKSIMTISEIWSEDRGRGKKEMKKHQKGEKQMLNVENMLYIKPLVLKRKKAILHTWHNKGEELVPQNDCKLLWKGMKRIIKEPICWNH